MMDYTLHTIWGWREEGPELLDTWEQYAVENNEDGYREALEKALATVMDDGNGFWKEAGIRVFEVSVDWGKIEGAFQPAVIEGQVKAGDPKHPVVALVSRLAAMDNPDDEAAQQDRRTVTLAKIVEDAREALDAAVDLTADA